MATASATDRRLSQQLLRRTVLPAFAIVAVLLILSLALTESDTPRTVRTVATLAVLAFGWVSAEVFVRLAVRYFPDADIPPLVAIAMAEVGSLIGFAIALSVQALMGYVVPVTWTTILEATVSGPVWILAVGNVIAARWRYMNQRQALLDESIAAESTRQLERDALSRARDQVSYAVRPSLIALRNDIDAVLSTPLDTVTPPTLQAQAASLRRAANDVVRPLSHRIYSSHAELPTPRQPLRFLTEIVRTQPFRPGLVALLYVVTAMPRNLQEYGPVDGGIALAIDVIFIVVILGGANLLMRRWPRVHTGIYIGTLILVHGIPLILVLPGIAETDPQFDGLGALVEILISVALLVGTSSLGLVKATREDMLRELRRGVDDESLAAMAEGRVLALAARELGAALHGPVQSTVLASAAALERALDRGDRGGAREELASAAAAIDAALAGPPVADITLAQRLAEVTEPWRELCPVLLDLTPGIEQLEGAPAESLAVVVREAIANAFRHGKATTVDVRIESRPPSATVRVRDDGMGAGPKAWGLGLTLIDRASEGHWTLTRDGAHTVLEARIPLDQ